MALAVLLVTLMASGSGAQAQTEDAPSPEPPAAVDFSWDVAEYDKVLAATPPDEDIQLGDMFFRRATVQSYRDRLAGATSTQGAGVGTALWTGGNVFYTFDANITATQRQQFIDVTKEWSAFAKLTFTPRTTQPNYIRVVQPATGGCNSYVGMIGGPQAQTSGNAHPARL